MLNPSLKPNAFSPLSPSDLIRGSLPVADPRVKPEDDRKKKPNLPLIIAGFMSGTSLDGLDVAVIETDGHTVFQIYEGFTLPYPLDFQEELRSHHGARELSPGLVQTIQKLMDFHAQAFSQLKYKDSIDLVSVHGHTIFHIPRQDGAPTQTWQAVDPEYLQSLIHKPIVFDLRMEDIVQGGEGAPLVPIYHLALAEKFEKPVAFVNIGGVANITWIPSNNANDLIAGDVGPGMALMNDLMKTYTGQPYDADGALTATGQVDEVFVEEVMADPFFARPFPKSLDRETFAWVRNVLSANAIPALNVTPAKAGAQEKLCSDETSLLDSRFRGNDKGGRDDIKGTLPNALRTLCEITAQGIIKGLPAMPSQLILCGGGRKHLLIKSLLQQALSCPVVDIDELGIDGDCVEAQAWAFLAARHLYKLPYSFPMTTGVRYPTCGGRILPLD